MLRYFRMRVSTDADDVADDLEPLTPRERFRARMHRIKKFVISSPGVCICPVVVLLLVAVVVYVVKSAQQRFADDGPVEVGVLTRCGEVLGHNENGVLVFKVRPLVSGFSVEFCNACTT